MIDGFVDTLTETILNLDRSVVLVGHSFGGLIAAKVMERLDRHIHQLLLLQPVLHPASTKYKYPRITKHLLKYLKPSMLKKELLGNPHFVDEGERLDEYVQYVLNDLQSPRVRTTIAEVMSLLTRSDSARTNTGACCPA